MPDLLSIGQFLHLIGLWHGLHIVLDKVLSIVLVEGCIKWSDRFLLRLKPKINFESSKDRVVLDLLSRGQFSSTMSLSVKSLSHKGALSHKL